MPIFIPEKIKVGFQNRKGTYTGRLAYVIYYDSHGKLRKEISWNSWRHKDIEPQEFDNVPTEGFVLNKKAGGYTSHWNTRATYCRVYDPRGFEFEVTIDNLLYILESTDCIKGKGLAGDFVYGWSGKDLLLMPTCAADYAEVKGISDSVNTGTWLKGKDLTLGGIYLTNKGEHWVYLGRFDFFENRYWRNPLEHKNKGKHYFFSNGSEKLCLETTKSLTRRVISVVDSESVVNYAMLMDDLEQRREFSLVERSELWPWSKLDVAGFSRYDWKRKVVVNSENSDLFIIIKGDNFSVLATNASVWNETISSNLTLDELFEQYSLYKTVYYLRNGKQLKE